MEKLFVNLEENSYDIIIDCSYNGLPEALKRIKAPQKILIVTDANVEPLWLDNVMKKLGNSEYDIKICVLEAGEEHKNIDNILKICTSCLEHKMDRTGMIIALGGGVVGDMAGFASAIYMRGIRFIQLPTTLLSQTDSSIGGKTGVDFQNFKNILGAFHQPALVYVNVSTLKTLPESEIHSGMGEVIKHGIICDSDFFDFLYDKSVTIKSLDVDMLIAMIKTNCSIKASIVAKDEKENGRRVILNFGHTIGHAIESAAFFSITHGECVGLGMCAASHIAYGRQLIDKGIFNKITDILNKYGLKTKIAEIDIREIFRFMENDKKSVGGKLKFILPVGIGSVTETSDVNNDEIVNALHFLFN